MKIKEGFVIREIAGQSVVIGLGEASKTFGGIININDTGKFIWELMQTDIQKDEIVKKILDTYSDAEESRVRNDVDSFLQTLGEVGIIEQ